MSWHVPDEYLHLVECEQQSDRNTSERRSSFGFRLYAEPWHGLMLDTDISLFLFHQDK